MIKSNDADAPRLIEADRVAHLASIAAPGDWNDVDDQVGDTIFRFPGPITLVPTPTPWILPCIFILLASGMTAASTWVVFDSLSDPRPAAGAVTIGILGTAFFGACIVVIIIGLLPGPDSLQLDEVGLQVISLFRKRAYRWSDVSDFSVSSGYRMSGFVIFKEAKPSLTILEGIQAALQSGRNGALPNTYGFAAKDLAYLMNAWKNSATKRKSEPQSGHRSSS